MAQTQRATDYVQTPQLDPSAMEEGSVSQSSNSHSSRVRTLPLFSSRLASVISTFCIGLVSGAAGGLLLGAAAVVELQSLELLADNRLLMDQLGNIMGNNSFSVVARRHISQRDDPLLNTYISIFAEMFGVFTLTLSLAVGIWIGLSTYALVIKKRGEAAMGKALGLAGPVCLMGVTATGCFLGLTLERFLSITSNVSVMWWIIISVILTQAVLSISSLIEIFCPSKFPFRAGVVIPVAMVIMFATTFFVKTKLSLMFFSVTSILVVNELQLTGDWKTDFQLNIAPVPLMLIITDVFNIVGQPIVALQSPSSTNTSSVVPEGIFVGVLASQQFTVAIGMSLFVSWQRGGAGKICFIAAGSGTAVLGAMKVALPVLGPGPTIGALMGVAGAVGVSLAAAGAATDQYGQVVDHYGCVGRCGVTVGVAVGAFLSSSAHRGLSGTFMGLCAASIPAGLYLKQLLLLIHRHPMWWKSLCIIITIIILIWLYFICTFLFLVVIVKLCISLIIIIICNCFSFLKNLLCR